MIEETDEKEATSPEKLLFDNPFNFRFHAAYLVYAEIYDTTTNPEVKKELNQHIKALKQNEINYSKFYRNVNQYRTSTNHGQSRSRFSVKTQRKREWRRKTQKRERIKRHKK